MLENKLTLNYKCNTLKRQPLLPSKFILDLRNGPAPKPDLSPFFPCPADRGIGGAKRVITRCDVTIVMADHPNLILCLTTNNNSLVE